MMTSKLAHYRRKKGLSQEQLSVVSGVSARTIQRIESGKVEAHPATLKMLARVKPIFHILALIGLCFPIFNIILPLLFWFLKKDESPAYDLEGKLVVNFQITISIVFVPAIIFMIFVFSVGFPLVIIIYLYALIMCLINIFRTINKQESRYPLTCQFLK